MSAPLIILICALGLPAIVFVLLAVCGSLVWLGAQAGRLAGLGETGSAACGAALYCIVMGAACGTALAVLVSA
jgi:hypothetical protein